MANLGGSSLLDEGLFLKEALQTFPPCHCRRLGWFSRCRSHDFDFQGPSGN